MYHNVTLFEHNMSCQPGKIYVTFGSNPSHGNFLPHPGLEQVIRDCFDDEQIIYKTVFSEDGHMFTTIHGQNIFYF